MPESQARRTNMDSLDQESLFSLEIVVDKLSLAKVACRFPSVAFRLLDFPTLLINHVESELADTIKSKILSDPNYKLPQQLNELQDRDGNFPVCKGKTCLIKISPNAMHDHLTTTPLYVMIVDTFPETPKLIGNCTVPMDEVMESVFDDISEQGVSVPSAHGEKGIHNIFNLMGKHIGQIVFGFRIVSLGRGLIGHIPDNAITRSKAKSSSKVESKVESKVMQDEPHITEALVVHNLEAADKDMEVAIFPEKRRSENALSQTDRETLQTIATQTAERKKGKVKKSMKLHFQKEKDALELDDLVVTETYCPPPLFYNSNLPDYNPSLNILPQQRNQNNAKKLYSNGTYASPDSESELSDDSTIRQEDKYSDTESSDLAFLTSTTKVKAQHVTQNTTSVRKTILTKSEPYAIRGISEGQQFSQFPILNSLMNEIMAIYGAPQSPRHAVTPRPHTPITKEKHESFLVRMSSPRHKVEKGSTHADTSPGPLKNHRECSASEQPKRIPKNKSWLRKEPEKAVKKTKLFSGMTNTQRLRLAKTNPVLLKELVRDENERKNRRGQSKAGNIHDHSEYYHEKQDRNLGNIGSHPPPLNLGLLADSAELSHHSKKPIPTPRHSVSFRSNDFDAVQIPPITPRVSRGRKPKEQWDQAYKVDSFRNQIKGDPSEEEQGRNFHYQTNRLDQGDKSESASYKSIDVHVPSVSNESLYSDPSSDGEDEARVMGNRTGSFGKTKILSSPGFPRESIESRNSENPVYSEDFEPSSLGEQPESKQAIVRYSDEEEDEFEEEHMLKGPPITGEVPELRMMVDKYSDDESDRKSQNSEAKSFISARSYISRDSKQSGKSLRLNMQTIPNPPSSILSPTTGTIQKSTMPTREPVAASSSSLGPSATNVSYDSTAVIPQSHIYSPDSTYSEVSGDVKQPKSARQEKSYAKKPRPSPRMTREISVRTESVSSYAPSDTDNNVPLSPGSGIGGEYSDEFEDPSD